MKDQKPRSEDEESAPPSVKLALIADVCQDEAESIPIIDDSDGTEEWQVGSQLDSRQRAELFELLEKFQDRFGKKPGRTDLIEHVIRLTDEIPCRPRIYRVPESLKDQVKKQIQEMLELDLIQESESDFINPLVCVRKPDSSIRLCVDLKAVNIKNYWRSIPGIRYVDNNRQMCRGHVCFYHGSTDGVLSNSIESGITEIHCFPV